MQIVEDRIKEILNKIQIKRNTLRELKPTQYAMRKRVNGDIEDLNELLALNRAIFFENINLYLAGVNIH